MDECWKNKIFMYVPNKFSIRIYNVLLLPNNNNINNLPKFVLMTVVPIRKTSVCQHRLPSPKSDRTNSIPTKGSTQKRQFRRIPTTIAAACNSRRADGLRQINPQRRREGSMQEAKRTHSQCRLNVPAIRAFYSCLRGSEGCHRVSRVQLCEMIGDEGDFRLCVS